jgi:hypothetical protein
MSTFTKVLLFFTVMALVVALVLGSYGVHSPAYEISNKLFNLGFGLLVLVFFVWLMTGRKNKKPKGRAKA